MKLALNRGTVPLMASTPELACGLEAIMLDDAVPEPPGKVCAGCAPATGQAWAAA